MNVIKTFITSNLSCCRSKSTKTSLLWVELWEKPPTCTDAKPSYWSRTQALIPCFWAWLGLHANTLSCLTWFDDIKERVENMVSHMFVMRLQLLQQEKNVNIHTSLVKELPIQREVNLLKEEQTWVMSSDIETGRQRLTHGHDYVFGVTRVCERWTGGGVRGFQRNVSVVSQRQMKGHWEGRRRKIESAKEKDGPVASV